jgi:hypothetical protein
MTDVSELNEFKAELDDYIRKAQMDFYMTMDKKRVPYQGLLDRILSFYFVTSFVSEKKIVSIDERLKPLMLLYSKSSMSLLGIYSCLVNGLAPEAAIILRSLFENLITIEIITKEDVFNRLKLYSDYVYVAQWRHLEAKRKLAKERKWPQDKFNSEFEGELIDATKENFSRVRANYTDSKGKLKKWNWKIYKSELGNREVSIKFICHKLGRSEDYVSLYSTISELMHSSPLIEHVVTEGNVIFLTPKFSRLIINIGMQALGYSSDVVKHIVNFLDIPSKNAISSHIDSYIDSALHDF